MSFAAFAHAEIARRPGQPIEVILDDGSEAEAVDLEFGDRSVILEPKDRPGQFLGFAPGAAPIARVSDREAAILAILGRTAA